MKIDLHAEWLETNDLGGWASSTVCGMHTRRYHGLLVAAVKPPVARSVLVSKLDETLSVRGQSYDLSTNRYPGVIHPQGHEHLIHFERETFAVWTYEAGGVRLKKTVCAVYGENTTVVKYEAEDAPSTFSIYLRPFYAYRDYHALQHAFEGVKRDGSFSDGVFHYQPVEFLPGTYISIPDSQFHADFQWYYNFEYTVEEERGLDFREDLFTPGVFELRLSKGESVHVIISTDDPGGKSGKIMIAKEAKRREQLLSGIRPDQIHLRHLTLAADQFVVKRGSDLRTIIAGYHWFTDWGRDTMISLPGLTLTTGRYEDAKKILRAFAQSVDQGMLPNRFPCEE